MGILAEKDLGFVDFVDEGTLMTKKCIICKKTLEGEKGILDKNKFNYWDVLYDGVTFKAAGNYGTTVFDPLHDESYLELYLCDECIKGNDEDMFRIERGQEGQEGTRMILHDHEKRGEKERQKRTRQKGIQLARDQGKTLNRHQLLLYSFVENLPHEIRICHPIGDETFDLVIPAMRMAVKYMGKAHIEEETKRMDPIAQSLEAQGWRVILASFQDLYLPDQRAALLASMRLALED